MAFDVRQIISLIDQLNRERKSPEEIARAVTSVTGEQITGAQIVNLLGRQISGEEQRATTGLRSANAIEQMREQQALSLQETRGKTELELEFKRKAQARSLDRIRTLKRKAEGRIATVPYPSADTKLERYLGELREADLAAVGGKLMAADLEKRAGQVGSAYYEEHLGRWTRRLRRVGLDPGALDAPTKVAKILAGGEESVRVRRELETQIREARLPLVKQRLIEAESPVVQQMMERGTGLGGLVDKAAAEVTGAKSTGAAKRALMTWAPKIEAAAKRSGRLKAGAAGGGAAGLLGMLAMMLLGNGEKQEEAPQGFNQNQLFQLALAQVMAGGNAPSPDLVEGRQLLNELRRLRIPQEQAKSQMAGLEPAMRMLAMQPGLLPMQAGIV